MYLVSATPRWSPQESPWVRELQGCLSALKAKSDTEAAGLSAPLYPSSAVGECLALFWRSVTGVVATAIVEGLSRVRRCTMEGRSRMMLDMQMLSGHLRSLVPRGVSVDLSLVDEYVQGFYLEVSVSCRLLCPCTSYREGSYVLPGARSEQACRLN